MNHDLTSLLDVLLSSGISGTFKPTKSLATHIGSTSRDFSSFNSTAERYVENEALEMWRSHWIADQGICNEDRLYVKSHEFDSRPPAANLIRNVNPNYGIIPVISMAAINFSQLQDPNYSLDYRNGYATAHFAINFQPQTREDHHIATELIRIKPTLANDALFYLDPSVGGRGINLFYWFKMNGPENVSLPEIKSLAYKDKCDELPAYKVILE